MVRIELYLSGLPSNLVTRKTSDKSQLKATAKYLTRILQNCQGQQKQEKSE